MKIQFKIALVVGLTALLASCQKDELPAPDCGTNDPVGTNMRLGGPSENDNNALGGDTGLTADSTGIVSGGDDDRDGGIVGGGDDDKDGGSKKGGDKK